MTTATITNQVNNHVFLEFTAVISSNLGSKQDRFRIITIHMQNRCFNNLGNVGAVFSRTNIFALGGCKAHLVVDDDMNGTASLVSPSLGQLEGFHNNTLTRKCGITMH